MITDTFNSWRTEVIAFFYAFAFILLIAVSGGKQAVSWILMKLYEIFIKKDPVDSL